MRFCFPIYNGGPYRGWQVDLAFRLLERLGPGDSAARLRARAGDKLRRGMPLLRWLRDPQALDSVAMFREYQLDWPERICVDSVLDAERLGAVVRNYTHARIVSRSTDGWSIEMAGADGTSPSPDRDAGARTREGRSQHGWNLGRRGEPRCAAEGTATRPRHQRLPYPRQAASRLREYRHRDARQQAGAFLLHSVPGLSLLRPHRDPVRGRQDRIRVTAEERAWLIDEANRLLPQLKLTESDVLMTWAGVRPLTYDESVPFGNRSRVIHDLAPMACPMCSDDRGAGDDASLRRPGIDRRSSGGAFRRRAAQQVPDYTPARFPGRSGFATAARRGQGEAIRPAPRRSRAACVRR